MPSGITKILGIGTNFTAFVRYAVYLKFSQIQNTYILIIGIQLKTLIGVCYKCLAISSIKI